MRQTHQVGTIKGRVPPISVVGEGSRQRSIPSRMTVRLHLSEKLETVACILGLACAATTLVVGVSIVLALRVAWVVCQGMEWM